MLRFIICIILFGMLLFSCSKRNKSIDIFNDTIHESNWMFTDYWKTKMIEIDTFDSEGVPYFTFWDLKTLNDYRIKILYHEKFRIPKDGVIFILEGRVLDNSSYIGGVWGDCKEINYAITEKHNGDVSHFVDEEVYEDWERLKRDVEKWNVEQIQAEGKQSTTLGGCKFMATKIVLENYNVTFKGSFSFYEY